LVTDVVLAATLLSSSESEYFGYGVVSVIFVGLNLFFQVIHVVVHGKAPVLSFDVFMTAIFLGPLLHCFRTFFGEPNRRPGAAPAAVILGMLKGVEVTIESVPELVLQLSLLLRFSDTWSNASLIVSLVTSIVATGMLMVDAEVSANNEVNNRRRSTSTTITCRRRAALGAT
jgi:hypothetical protein